MTTRRTATPEELENAVRRYGPHRARRELLRYGLIPPIAGGAGWVVGQTNSTSVSGSSGAGQLAFASNVTAGMVVAVAACYVNTGTTAATWSDAAATPNVTSWSSTFSLGATGAGNTGFGFTIGWGVATLTGGCTPKVTFTGGTTDSIEISIGSFTAPAGTPALDGTYQTGFSTSGTNANTAANGSGSNDLLIALTAFGGGSPSLGGSWLAMGAAQAVGPAGYLANAAGNSANNATEGSGTGWDDLIVAIQVTAGANQNWEPNSDISVSGWTPSTGATIWGVVSDQSDSTYATATPS